MLSHISFIHKNKQLYTVLQPWTDGCTLIFLNICEGKTFLSLFGIFHTIGLQDEDPMKSKFVGGFATWFLFVSFDVVCMQVYFLKIPFLADMLI